MDWMLTRLARRRPPASRRCSPAASSSHADPRSPQAREHRVKVSTPPRYMSIWKKLATSAKYMDTEGALVSIEEAEGGG